MTGGAKTSNIAAPPAIARQRRAKTRKTKMERKERRHGAMLWMAEKPASEEREKALALWGRKGESGVRG